MNTRTLIVAIAVVAVVGIAAVALALSNNGSSGDGSVEYNYDFSVDDYNLYGENYRVLGMDLAVKNINHVSIPAEGGLRLDYMTVTVKYNGGELFKDHVMSGVMSPGNDYVTQVSWNVSLDFTIDQIENVEIGWQVPEGAEELVGEIDTPEFVYNESLSTDKYA